MKARLAAILVLAGCGDNLVAPCASWTQWGGNLAHDGAACVDGQPLARVLAEDVFDPFTELEQADADGALIVHYQAPLTAGDDVYMMAKAGTYTPCAIGPDGPDCTLDPYRRNSQQWIEKGYRWIDGALVEQWSFTSDWKPEPGLGFEPMFQPALAGDVIVVPGAGGSVYELDRVTGAVVRHVQPFGAVIDPDVYVAGGIAVGVDGTRYYNALRLDHDMPWLAPAASWLVAVAPDGALRTVDYATVTPLGGSAPCYGSFDPMTVPFPWPPPPQPDGSPTLPAEAPCGDQRPGVNTTPAISYDGTIFAVTRAHFNGRYSHVTALAPDLTVVWSTSLRDRLADGCGDLIPADGTDTENLDHCRVGAEPGVEPGTNLPPAGQVVDASSSSPVALPDGGVVYGAATFYNAGRGHLFALDANGEHVATYEFGWDTTPAVTGTASSYTVTIKDNHYGEDEATGVDLGPFELTRLNRQLDPIWRFRNTETRSCIREPDGDLVCVDDHPNGFEWCINALAVDLAGVTYANAEDGYVYAITADGTLRDRLFLDRSLGAAYTPLSLDPDGRIYALNNGRMIVAGR